MFFHIRRLLKHSVVYGLGHVISRVVSFVLLPFLTHSLNPEQYGVMTLLYTFISIVQVVYIYGADIAFLRYYIPEKDEEKRMGIFSTVLWATLAGSVLLSLIIVATSGWITRIIFNNPGALDANTGYLIVLSVGILFCDTLATYPYLWFRSVEKSLPFIAVKSAGVALHVGLTVVFLAVLDRGIRGIFEANLIASAAQLAVLLPVILRNTRAAFHMKLFGEMFRFGIPNMPSQLFVMVVELSDRKILELMLGLTAVGLYSAGYKLGLFMAVITMGFRFAWQPFFMSIADRPDARETFARVFTYFILVAGTLFLGFTFLVGPLMKINLPVVGVLIEERYWPGLKVFPVILLAHICNGAYANFMVGVYLTRKTGLMPLVTGAAAVVNLAVNLLLIPVFGMMAAAWSHVAAYLTLAGLLYVLIQKHYYIKYEWTRVATIVACGGLVYALSTIPFLEAHWPLKLLLLPAFFLLLKASNFFLPEELAAVRRRLFPSRAG
ncbi:MAG: hypothetical protein C4524_04960 [Candidatus Zixiibacteriota bacterium]|nr:MAG: hypothetical protein C4524_04960 [candidate division Zixibacteria bacterium]